jgi:asparagine synthase (glutamine-hydrolysing)
MCGIAGWYRRGGRPVAESLVAAQCDTIRHRGPDDAGYFTDGDVGIGMRRLSIIDLTGGHQPMTTDDDRHAIVFNGEIYNHPELRPELEARGYRFHTHSDTETLLAAYVLWGDDAWLRLEGMYAVAIFDKHTRTLTLARDPLGIKPLYVTEQNGGIAFGSELKTLTLLPDHRFDVDERAVHDYFSFGHVQRPRSIYRQVRQLDPGYVLRIGPEGEAREHRFWKPEIRIRHGLSEAEWIEETRATLLQSVKRHMLADVPVGSFLSGGVDSAAVTAAMARQSSQRITAFTIGFPGNPIDETSAARRIAEHLGCDHLVQPLELARARDLIPAVQESFDEPSGASAAIPTWYLSKLAAQHVKVVLSGEGGDELFAGYKRQRNAIRMDRLRPLLKAAGPLAALIDRLPRTSSRRWNYIPQYARRFREAALLQTGFQRFIAGTQIMSADMRGRVYDPGFLARQEQPLEAWEAEYFAEAEWRDATMLQQFMLGDLAVHMPSALLNRLDRTSMAHSLEARVPLLSHKFVDWSLTVPTEMKAKGAGKHVLREAARPWLPEGILERRKQGFQMPLTDWFLGDFSDFARESWHGSGAAQAGYLEPRAVDALFDEHRSGRANHAKLLYAITMFSCWWQMQRVQPEARAA